MKRIREDLKAIIFDGVIMLLFMFFPIAFGSRLDITAAEFYFEFRYVGMTMSGLAAVNGISALRRLNKLCRGEQIDEEK